MLLTSAGRILECKESLINAYLTGERTIWATAINGVGIGNFAYTQFMYALYNRIVEINQDKEMVKWKYIESPSSIPYEKVIGVFVSQVLYVQEDIGEWRRLIWSECKEENTDIIVSLRAANSINDLLFSKWQYSFNSNDGEIGQIIRDLNDTSIKGKYAQIKVEMISKSNISPSVADVSLIYSAKQASYFFTTRFSLDNGVDINKSLLIAEITEHVNTEVSIGICEKESNDWNDYTIVPTERFFDVDRFSSIKIGIKFNMYDETNVPSVANFAMIFGDDKSQRINE
jgi:hypothetical protein